MKWFKGIGWWATRKQLGVQKSINHRLNERLEDMAKVLKKTRKAHDTWKERAMKAEGDLMKASIAHDNSQREEIYWKGVASYRLDQLLDIKNLVCKHSANPAPAMEEK